MKLPLLYNPPKGTPPVPAAESSAKFKLADTVVNIIAVCEPENDPLNCPLPAKAILAVVVVSEYDALVLVLEYDDVIEYDDDTTPVNPDPSPEKDPVTGEDPVTFNDPDIVKSYAAVPVKASVSCVIWLAVILPPLVIPVFDIKFAIVIRISFYYKYSTII